MRDVVDILRELIAIPSVNPLCDPEGAPDGEAALGRYLERCSKQLGLAPVRQEALPGRDNIVVAIGPDDAKRRILFVAHQDTVPPDHLHAAPFEPQVRDGRIHGRGACDVKGGLAAMLHATARVAADRLPVRVTLACTVDEEHSFGGIARLLADAPDATEAVVAEPTSLAIVRSHKGVMRSRVVVHGRSCHAASPHEGENAILRAGRVLSALEEYAGRLIHGERHEILGTRTVSPGLIRGGTFVNVVANRCTIELDHRLLPGDDPETTIAELRSALHRSPRIDFDVDVEPVWRGVAGLSGAAADPVIGRLAAAIDGVRGAHDVVGVAYATEAAAVEAHGIPVVVFGPGDIAQAHTADEWIDENELRAAAEILYRFARHE